MLELRYPARWQTAGLILLVLALAASLLPDIPFWPDDPIADFEISDKLLHLLAFFALTIWFSGQYATRSYWRMALGLLAFGGLIEVLQGLTTYRMSEWMDLFADGGGILLGLAVALLGVGGWSQRLEARMLKA